MRFVACIVAVAVGLMVVSSFAEEAAKPAAPAPAACFVCKDCKVCAEKAGKCACGKDMAEMAVVEKKEGNIKVCAKDNMKDGKVVDESACLTVKAAGEAKKEAKKAE
jgi:hypothetical protein